MTSRLASLVVLAVVAGAACASEPPKSADAPALPPDKTEVKMEVVPIADAAPPEPALTAPSTIAQAEPVDPADDPNIGGPQDETVEKAVAPIRPRIRACYKKAVAKHPGLAGSVTFDTVIAKTGKVSSVRFVKKDDGLPEDMIECLSTAAKTMQFAPDRKSQVVAFTFGPRVGDADAGAPKH